VEAVVAAQRARRALVEELVKEAPVKQWMMQQRAWPKK
jgi:hypothetical protein